MKLISQKPFKYHKPASWSPGAWLEVRGSPLTETVICVRETSPSTVGSVGTWSSKSDGDDPSPLVESGTVVATGTSASMSANV